MARTITDIWSDVFGDGSSREGATKLLHRKLEDRSKLDFVFPQGGDASPVIFQLPFYENINLSETKGARLARYSPVGRPNPMHSYLSGKPRIFRLEFNLTLPHLQFEATALSIDRFMNRSLLDSKEQKRVNFLLDTKRERYAIPDSGSDIGIPLMSKVQEAIRGF